MPGLCGFAGSLAADPSSEASLRGMVELLRHRPYGIDISSGVESSPGVKDASELRKLFERVAAAPVTRNGAGEER